MTGRREGTVVHANASDHPFGILESLFRPLRHKQVVKWHREDSMEFKETTNNIRGCAMKVETKLLPEELEYRFSDKPFLSLFLAPRCIRMSDILRNDFSRFYAQDRATR